jgi:hypothetical protein
VLIIDDELKCLPGDCAVLFALKLKGVATCGSL